MTLRSMPRTVILPAVRTAAAVLSDCRVEPLTYAEPGPLRCAEVEPLRYAEPERRGAQVRQAVPHVATSCSGNPLVQCAASAAKTAVDARDGEPPPRRNSSRPDDR